MAADWNEFITTPNKAAKKLHVTSSDVARGAQIDALSRQLGLAALRSSVGYPSRENAERLPLTKSERNAEELFRNALLVAPETSAVESPSRASQIARAALSGAGSFGGYMKDPINEPTLDMLARTAGEMISDPLNVVGLGALKYVGNVAKKVLPAAATLSTSGYSSDAQAASKYDPRAFLRYIQERFPDMLPAVKQGMKFTADTGREAGIYGLQGPNLRQSPELFVKGQLNSVVLPPGFRRKLIDDPNAFDLHTHPSGNALPSTPLNNAAQNILGGDTQYYQQTGRGTKWLRPGKADNLIVGVTPRSRREPLSWGNGRGESWTHMKMNEYPLKDSLSSLTRYLDENAERYESLLPEGDMGQMIPDDAATFALLKHYADTGRGDFTYNLGREAFGPGGRELATPMYEAIYDALRKDKHLRNYSAGGSIAGAAKRLARRAMPAFTEGYPPLAAPPGALSVVKPKGGNWINNSVEDALRGLKKREMNPLVEPDLIPEIEASKSINNWIEGPLTKYVKTRMASPEDEVRALAEQGVLHFDPRVDAAMRRSSGAQAHRQLAGDVGQELGVTPAGKRWEDLTDSAVLPGTYRNHLPFGMKRIPEDLRLIGGDFAVKNSDATAYVFDRGQRTNELGFDHLIDELSNALNPDSGLPRHLQLSPEAVKNMSMEKAVRRVSDINAWRAEQKTAANAELANKAMVVREYTENNPKGLRWVELKAGDDPYTVGSDGKNAADVLEQQLRYEGDTMGHCVGGYCDDVVSGRSRIFSLRDAKGEPHVTVEVHPKWNNKMGKESATEDAIVQIKGKQNRKPNDEYLPFVQDFVRNNPLGGTWGDVGDLGNTGMFRVQKGQKWPGFAEDMPEGFYTLDEAERLAKEKGMDAEVLNTWLSKLRNPRNYASGGSVQHTPQNNFQGIIAAIEKELQHA